MGNKWMTQILKEDKKLIQASAILDIKQRMMPTSSPSLNWATFGGIPRGHFSVFYGPEGGSKSTLAMNLIAQIQKEDPEAIGFWFDSELSFSPQWAAKNGVDVDRVVIRPGNIASEIFDYISGPMHSIIQEGAPVKFMVLDSVTALVGPKQNNLASSGDQTMGDLSKFLSENLPKALNIIHEHNLLSILISQVRDNLDPATSKYTKYILPSGRALKHNSSLTLLIEKINSKESNVFDESSSNMNDTHEIVGKKIRVKVTKTRAGGEGRVAEFCLHFEQGFIRPGEEVAKLGINQGAIERPNNMTYILPLGKKFVGAKNLIEHLEQNPEARQEVMDAVHKKGSE